MYFMGFYENFPYTNFHEINLDWIIQIVKDLNTKYPEQLIELKNEISKLFVITDETNKRVATLESGGLENNVTSIIREYIASMIYPEITDSGYIAYNIPGEWFNITFNTTGLDIVVEIQSNYGHLVLSY